MNDASPRFAKGQTGAASLPSSEERSLRLAELAQHAVELSAWVTEEGLRGATAGELFDGYCQRFNDAQSASRSGAPPRDHHACDAARRDRVRIGLSRQSTRQEAESSSQEERRPREVSVVR
jgi:hypothetical protein